MICVTRLNGVFLIGLKNYPRRCGEHRKNQDIDWHNAKDPEEPTKPLAFELLASAIRLPYQYSDSPKNRVNGQLRFDASIEELEDERIDSWQKSFMLAGELILPFEL